jgi:hypothetical protein
MGKVETEPPGVMRREAGTVRDVKEVAMAERSKKEERREKVHRWMPEEAREHFKAARTELHESAKVMLPPEFLEHRRAARREMLLAARSLIDHALERMEKSQGN